LDSNTPTLQVIQNQLLTGVKKALQIQHTDIASLQKLNKRREPNAEKLKLL